jgi:cytochrome c-type biogenesis protein
MSGDVPMASSIGFVAAFMAGLISFLSPCVLPLVPGYVSYVAGRSVQELEASADWRDRAKGVGLSLVFVLGFSTVFVGIGASATALGQLILTHKQVLNLIGGAILMAFGLFMTGLLDIAFLHRDFRFHPAVMVGRAPSAFLLGLAFAFGWTPCIGPVLGSIMTLGASLATVKQGVILLSVYSLGLGVPFVLTALFTTTMLRGLWRLRRLARPLQIGFGLVVVAMGIAMISGKMSLLAVWFLQTFPMLQSIG